MRPPSQPLCDVVGDLSDANNNISNLRAGLFDTLTFSPILYVVTGHTSITEAIGAATGIGCYDPNAFYVYESVAVSIPAGGVGIAKSAIVPGFKGLVGAVEAAGGAASGAGAVRAATAQTVAEDLSRLKPHSKYNPLTVDVGSMDEFIALLDRSTHGAEMRTVIPTYPGPGQWLLVDGSWVGIRTSIRNGWTMGANLGGETWKVHINGGLK